MTEPFSVLLACVLLLAVAAILLLRPPVALLLVFTLVCFFPEFSQTDWNVWTADDFRSLYNFRPIPEVPVSIFDYLFALVVAGWAARFILDKRRSLSVPCMLPLLLFLGTVVAGFAQGVVSGSEAYYIMRELRVFTYFAIVYYMIATTCTEAFVRHWAWLTVGLAAIRGIEGVGRYLLGIGKDFFDTKLVYYDTGESFLFLILFVLLLGWNAARYEGFRSRRTRLLVLALPCVFCFVFSFRRGIWLAAAFCLLRFILSRASRRQQVICAVVVTFVVTIAIVVGSYDVTLPENLDFIGERAMSITDMQDESSNVFRLLDIRNTLTAVGGSPLFGVGLGGRYRLVYASGRAVDDAFMEHVSRGSHNGILLVALKLGVPALFLYLAFFFKFFRSMTAAGSRAFRPFSKGTLIGVDLGILAFLVAAMTGPHTDHLRATLLLAYLLGVGAILMRQIRQDVVELGKVDEPALFNRVVCSALTGKEEARARTVVPLGTK
jgi:hypothetical protein